MAFTRFARFIFHVAVALVIATFVAVAQFAVWYWVTQGQPMTPAENAITGYAYSGYARDQNPMEHDVPSQEQLTRDLGILAHTAKRIRTYSAIDYAAVAPLAAEHGLRLTGGIWLDQSVERDMREVEAGIALVEKYPKTIDRIIVGNETLLREDLAPETLILYLNMVRKATRKPVSTAEPWHVWIKYPELAENVDFITVHLLPYHEGVPAEQAVGYAMQRYRELERAFPHKKIVIGEIGWPSRGPKIEEAVASRENEALFLRTFLALDETPDLDYFIMEAFDQPWKVELEGWAGAYWGVYDADRKPKFSLTGEVPRDIRWERKARQAALYAFVPMFLITLLLGSWSLMGRIWLAVLIQASVITLIMGANVPAEYYLTHGDLVGLTVLIAATLISISVLLTHGYEFGEVLFKRLWKRRFTPLPPLPPEREPFVSIHLACYNEPPEMVIATLDSLARSHYRNFEVLVIDNNTADEALWKPVEAHVAKLGANFRFFHLRPWPGFKAGALNFARGKTNARAEIIGVVDADYVVDPDWISTLVPHFQQAPEVAVVQAPQAHRDWETQPFRRMCNWEFDGFFRIGMHHRNERNALIQHGTMTLVRRKYLDEVGGWSEWCICEDSELGLRLLRRGYDTRYVDHVLGKGLTPANFAAIKSQRFRWAFGAMQILKAHFSALVGHSKLNMAQRYHFLTGWFAWFGEALQLVFTVASLVWTVLMIAAPKSFGLPMTVLVAPMLGFMAFKAMMGPILYRRTMNCSWMDIAGASLLSAGLSHTVARGVFAGIFRKKGVFVVTPKSWNRSKGLAFFAPIREEMTLLFGLLAASVSIAASLGFNEPAARAWIAVLLFETIPYWAALGCQIASNWPEKSPQDGLASA
ncbi:MAG: glycosyltransferase [Methylobacillus sp.]|jgi:exo-beta-1,3-glucanase (GH17 family)/cellulose synthase/poly-beta-1,6-N-acetylglucosamine synthase-like glycosyltransferase|nr:glycosyltransferase [Methylobacillus sp.]